MRSPGRAIPFALFRQRFEGADGQVRISGLDLRPAVRSYLFGDTPAAWRKYLPTYKAIQYRSLYPGIDLRYEGLDGGLKSTWTVRPGADPGQIRWRYQGVDAVTIDPASGDLRLSIDVRLPPEMQAAAQGRATISITVTERAPVAWQETAGVRTTVPVQFTLDANGSVRLALGAYDPTRPLTIDPEIVYDAPFGGSGYEFIYAMARHPDGSLVVTGTTSSVDWGRQQGTGTMTGVSRVFVSKRSVTSGTEQWSTFFGSNASDSGTSVGNGVAVFDGTIDGLIAITGTTSAVTFASGCRANVDNLIVATLRPENGDLVQRSCMGAGLYDNRGYAIVATSTGTLWIAGTTLSGAFLPTGTGTTHTYGIAPRPAFKHGFLFQLDPNTMTVLTRIYLGGGPATEIRGLALDAQNRPAVVGWMKFDSASFEFTTNAAQSSSQDAAPGIGWDAFVMQFSDGGSQQRYSSLISGNSEDYGNSVAVGADGHLYVTGESLSTSGLPLTASSAWRTTNAGDRDVFVVRLNPAPSSGQPSLEYGSLLGSSGSDAGYGIAARNGWAYVTGRAAAASFPLNAPLQAFSGSTDIFVAALDTTVAQQMPVSTFLGGANIDEGRGIVVDAAGAIYVGGTLGGATANTGQAFLSRVDEQLLSLTVTDANGQLVTGLTTQNGWPMLNSANNAIANPLTVTAQFVNTDTTPETLLVQLDATAQQGARFWTEPASVQECAPTQLVHYNANPSSFTQYQQTCTATLVPAQTMRSFTWKVWVQPSLAGSLTFNARLGSPDLLAERTTLPVTIPPASNIRPVVVIPGFFGSLWRNTSVNGIPTSGLVLDPLNNTYEGLLRQLRILGYEDQTTIVTFAYPWYSFNLEELGDQLNDRITTWWNGKTPPAYAHATQFDIVAHSTGGLIARQYADDHGASRLHNVFFVATPQQGAPMAFGALEGLDPQNALPGSANFETNMSDSVMLGIVRSLAKKAGCFTEWLLPYNRFVSVSDEKLYAYVQGQACTTTTILPTGAITEVTGNAQPGIPVFRELLPTTAAVINYLNGSYLQGQSGYIPPPSPVSARLNALNLSTVVNEFVQGITANDGRIFVLYSSSWATPKGYTVENDPVGAPSPLWLDGAATPIGWDKDSPLDQRRSATGYNYAAGDFVVPIWSADFQSLVDPAYHSSITKLVFEDIYVDEVSVQHAWYFKDHTRALKQIVGRLIIPNANLSWLNSLPLIDPVDINYPEVFGRVFFENYCPVTMLITDPQGRRIGTTSTGIDVNEVDQGVYTGHSDGNQPDLLWFAATVPGTYTVTITGRAAEPFQVRGRMIEPAGETPLGLWTGTLQPGQSVTYTFTVSPNQDRPILLIDDQAGTSVMAYYQNAFQQLGIAADTWNVSQQGIPTPTDLMSYDRAVWVAGNVAGLDVEALLSIGAYLDLGGSLLLTGQDVEASMGTTDLFAETLHATIPISTTTSQTLAGADLLAGITMVLNGGDSANNQATPSVLAELPGATRLATYQDGATPGSGAALRFANGQGRLVYLGFGIEGIQTAATRATVLERLLDWLDPRQSEPNTPPPLGLINGSFEQGLTGWSANILNGTIGASSTAFDGASATQISGQVLLDQVVTGLVPDTQYTLSAWVQAANGPDHPVWLWISEYGGETLFQGAVDTQGWEQLTHVFQTGPTNTRVRVRIQTPTLGAAALVDQVQLAGPLAPPPPDPPPGTMPGLLEAEDAPTIFDTDAINEGGVYRTDGLDVEECPVCLRTGSDGYSVGWTAPGEWLEFPVTFATSGSYQVRVRITTPEANQALRVRMNGVDVTGVLALPQTGGWGNWQDVTSTSFSASAGAATIRIELLSDMFSLDMIEIVPAGS